MAKKAKNIEIPKKEDSGKWYVPKTFLVMKSGERYEITGENGKYYLCNGTQFRKGNQSIEKVEVVSCADC